MDSNCPPELANEEVSFVKGYEDFFKFIGSDKAFKITDPGELQHNIRLLHDLCYGINKYTFSPLDTISSTHDSLKPIAMKDAFNLHGTSSLFYMYVEDFVHGEIYKNTGLDLIQWLHIERTQQVLIRKVIDAKRKRDLEINRSVSEEFKSEINKEM